MRGVDGAAVAVAAAAAAAVLLPRFVEQVGEVLVVERSVARQAPTKPLGRRASGRWSAPEQRHELAVAQPVGRERAQGGPDVTSSLKSPVK